LADVASCPFNISYADRDGHIGYVMTGSIPRRRVGSPTRPLEGWTGEWDWQGRVPYNQHPHAYDPPNGFIVTANQRPAGASYPYELGTVFEPSERADRLTHRLKELGHRITFEDLVALQLDTTSLMGRATRDAYLEIVGGVDVLAARTPHSREAASAWATWDGEARRDSVGATVAYLTVFEIARAVVAALAGDDVAFGLMEQPSFTHLPLTRFPKMRTRLEQLGIDLAAITHEAFARAVARCRAELGADVATWHWGRVHTLTLKHPFHHTVALRTIFSIGPEPSDGSSDTVNRGDVHMASPHQRVGAAMRLVMSARPHSEAASILPGGQSGDRMSVHYDDQFPEFLAGRLKPAPFAEPHAAGRRRENLWPKGNNVA
jgi:penicillin amidase